MVKIRLLKTLPLIPEHGAVAGLEVEARVLNRNSQHPVKWAFISPDSGVNIYVFEHEAEELSHDLAR